MSIKDVTENTIIDMIESENLYLTPNFWDQNLVDFMVIIVVSLN